MDAAIKQKWVDALRSGEFKQGYETLETKSGAYCCLGVLCVVTNSKGWDGWAGLPKPLEQEFFGNYGPRVDYAGKSERLEVLNDDYRLSFNQIADIIEEQL